MDQLATALFDFDVGGFMPHGHCYRWEPKLVWTMVVTDGLIGLAYVSISVTLYRLVRRARIPFSAVFVAFGVFILACGATHLFEVYTLWRPSYWTSAAIKAITAGASVITAVGIFPVRPRVEALVRAAEASEARQKDLQDKTAALEEALRTRDEFLSIASHELKTPLSSLLLQLQMLLHTTRPEEEIERETLAKRLEVCDRQTKKLAALLEELLDLARIRSGTMTLTRQKLDLAMLLREVVARQTAGLAPGTVATRVEASLEGLWDPMRLEQVITNLLSNALKHGEGKSVEVRLSQDPQRRVAVLEVQDSGVGISPALQRKIFERYERGGKSSLGGLGLGLYITRQIVEAHGGSISVSSVPGQGATFTVLLPTGEQGDAS